MFVFELLFKGAAIVCGGATGLGKEVISTLSAEITSLDRETSSVTSTIPDACISVVSIRETGVFTFSLILWRTPNASDESFDDCTSIIISFCTNPDASIELADIL